MKGPGIKLLKLTCDKPLSKCAFKVNSRRYIEGIVFSVRPPKKSWKNIANLSGGEKVGPAIQRLPRHLPNCRPSFPDKVCHTTRHSV